ncbi:MAG: ATP-binding protein, partial [Lachnospiraceae bacterium]
MEIERLDLIRWGKFSGHTIRLKSGVNIIYGGNESGKSTIHSFLGAMLFGTLQKAEKGRLASDTFLTGGDGEGAMTIWDGGQRYELHRTFAPAPGILSVRQETEDAEDLNSWEELDEPQEMLSDLLGGLDAETFESTVFWKQNQTAWDLYVEDGLKHCLKASKTGESVDGAQALQVLEERRGKAEQKKKKEEDALEERIRKRQTEAEYVRREAGRLQAQCNALRVGAQKEEEEEDWEREGFTETGKNLIQM